MLDHKQIGNQYMHQAKTINREHVNKKTKKHMMNLQTKVVGYGSDILDKIARNTSDLSKMRPGNGDKQALEEQEVQLPALSKAPSEKGSNRSRKQPNPEASSAGKESYELRSDEETRRYLTQIRQNLEEIERFEGLQLRKTAALASSQATLIPTTML